MRFEVTTKTNLYLQLSSLFHHCFYPPFVSLSIQAQAKQSIDSAIFHHCYKKKKKKEWVSAENKGLSGNWSWSICVLIDFERLWIDDMLCFSWYPGARGAKERASPWTANHRELRIRFQTIYFRRKYPWHKLTIPAIGGSTPGRAKDQVVDFLRSLPADGIRKIDSFIIHNLLRRKGFSFFSSFIFASPICLRRDCEMESGSFVDQKIRSLTHTVDWTGTTTREQK